MRSSVKSVSSEGSKSLMDDCESALVAVLRYSDHADPMLCVCGLSWGTHGCKNTPPREEYRYDFTNPANAVVKLRAGHSVAVGYSIDPYGA